MRAAAAPPPQRVASSESHASARLLDPALARRVAATAAAAAATAAAAAESNADAVSDTSAASRGSARSAKLLWHSSLHSLSFLRHAAASALKLREDGEVVLAADLSDEQLDREIHDMSREDLARTVKRLYGSVRQYRTLLTDVKGISSNLSRREVFDRIVTRAQATLRAEVVTLFLCDGLRQCLYSVASTRAGALTVPMDRGFAGSCALQRRTVLVNNRAHSSPLYSPDFDRAFHTFTSSIMCVPVFDENKAVLGVIQVVNRSVPKPFGGEDQLSAEFIALVAGYAINNASLLSEALTARKHTETLLQISELISSQVASDRIIQRIVEAAYTLVHAELVTLFLVDHERGQLLSVFRGDGRAGGPLVVPMSSGAAGFAAKTGKSVCISDAEQDWRFAHEERQMRGERGGGGDERTGAF